VGPERDLPHPVDDRRPSAYSAYPVYPGSGPSRPLRPPLTKRMRLGHWIALDCAVGGFVAISGAAVAAHATSSGPKLPLVLLLMVVLFIPVGLRRRAPVAALCGLVVLGVLAAAFGPALTTLVFLGAAFVLYTVTVESRRRSGLAALVLLMAVMAFAGVTGGSFVPRQEHVGPGELVPVALAGVIAWMTGYSVRQRRLYVVTLQHQAANSAVAEERLRIARELHDVVAHSMSVIAVQAGYGQYVIDVSPDGAREALGAIQATSRDALDEMRRMLGVLRQQDAGPVQADADTAQTGSAGAGPAQAVTGQAVTDQPAGQAGVAEAGTGGACGPAAAAGRPAAPLAPAPGLAGLERLVARTCGAGVRVTVEVSGQPRPAPAGVDLSAYRIIQEALTNVVRHAGTGAVCVVSLCYTDADLVIRVADDGGLPAGLGTAGIAAAGTGHGIIGMRERVHLCGGTFAAGTLPHGGFEVTASLPLPLPPPVRGDRAVTPAWDAGDAAVGPVAADPVVGGPAVVGPMAAGPMAAGPMAAGPVVVGTVQAAGAVHATGAAFPVGPADVALGGGGK
jgi:signal transduction histidine kinase